MSDAREQAWMRSLAGHLELSQKDEHSFNVGWDALAAKVAALVEAAAGTVDSWDAYDGLPFGTHISDLRVALAPFEPVSESQPR